MGTIWTPILVEDFHLNRLTGSNGVADRAIGQCQSEMLDFSYSFAHSPICIIFVNNQVPPSFLGARELDFNGKV